jgi:putative nucleotidyltransferase with HDIG domain
MNNPDILQVIRRIRDLPPLPSIVLDLISSFEREDVDVGLLAEKISRDQALSAKMLRLANSSFYGLPSKVSTVNQAIVVLGFDSARALAVASNVIESFEDAKAGEIDVAEFWRHSIAAALCARGLARHAKLAQDHAFIAGLLHDVGRLVLASGFPEHYAMVVEHCAREGTTLSEAELRVLGVDHQRVGQLLAEAWKFPMAIQRAIGQHHAPAGPELANLAGLIHAANAVVQALDLGCSDHAAVPHLQDATWTRLHISPEQLQEACRETEAQFEETCQLLMCAKTDESQ